MKSITLESLTAEQQLVVDIILNEGKLQAYEELLKHFKKEYDSAATEDPHYAYYSKYVVETIQGLIDLMEGN